MDYIGGRNPVLEHLKTGGVEKLYIRRGDNKGSIRAIIAMARDQGLVVTEVGDDRLREMAGDGNHQGVVAQAKSFEYSDLNQVLEDAKAKGETIRLVILDEIEDPHNLGAIIRTAEAAGFTGVIIPERRSASVTAAVHKASAGATAFMKVIKVVNINQTIQRLKEENIWVYGAAGEAKTLYTQANLTGHVCLVIGNEGKGISRLVRENCDELLSLPMVGRVESLNASNAAAIMIYEVLRQNESL